MSTPISGITNPGDNEAPTSLTRTGSSALGKNEFLKILVAQMANQDPTEPKDSSQFVAELAQFSSLEAQQNTVSSLNSLMLGQATANQTAAATFIGKKIDFNGGKVDFDGATAVAASARLEAQASKLDVTITDANGKIVRTLQLGARGAGDVQMAWDGRDDKGAVVPKGSYSMQPVAYDANNKAVSVALSTSGTVSGVAFQGGVPYLRVGSNLIKMSDVTSINERNTP
jgi:flagellar basal-body rod modification protein FlgD